MSSSPSSLILAEPGASYRSGANENQWVEVLVDCPGVQQDQPQEQKLYTYRLPSELKVQPGDILSVPFGSQTLGAIAIRLLDSPPPDLAPGQKIQEVEDVACSGYLSTCYFQLLERVAKYYCTPLITAIRVALPSGLLSRSQRRIRLAPAGAAISTDANASGEMSFVGMHNPLLTFLAVSQFYSVLLYFYLRKALEQDLLVKTLALCEVQATVGKVNSPSARQILKLLQAQKDGDYSWPYLQRQVVGASWGLRELLRRGLVESYLYQTRTERPQLKPAVTLVNHTFSDDLTQRQQEILGVLRRRNGDLWLTELLQTCNTTSSTIKKLEEKGYVVIQEREILRTATEPALARDIPKPLELSQAKALEVINSLDSFAQVLLHGVTGSGKTEVYLQAIAPILERGQSALVLVPEIGLTPQLSDRFRARFGNKIRTYHSALSPGERYDTWRQMLSGEPQIVIGTRSAIFAPLPKLGLIVLDEEHDSSFKQDDLVPTYHARTVAKWRAELENCPLILGSATPSLETWVNIRERGKVGENLYWNPETVNKTPLISPSPNPPLSQSPPLPIPPSPNPPLSQSHYLSLPERIQSRPMPPVEIVDMRQELQQGNRSIFSRLLYNALQKLHSQGQQGILFIPRRGHSTFVSCRSCGYVVECPNCDVSLSYHYTHEGATQLLRCHYCNHRQLHPPHCPECTSPYLKFFGNGTQRLAQELTQQFPQLRIIRFDSDTTQTKGAHRTLLTKFANGEADLLIGTQMLTKGLDIAQVTLVGVVSADGLLNLADYRAAERSFQTLTQVAGRAGRGKDPGRVIIQTYSPQHPVIQAVRRHDYESFAQTELEQRAALQYPPYGHLILLRLSGLDEADVENTALALADQLSATESDYEILGPAPASIMRVARRYRWQILLKFPPDVPVVLPNLAQLRERCPKDISLTIDVDPLNMM